MTPEDLVNVEDALALLRPIIRDRKTVYRLIERGEISGRKINGTYWITRKSIDAYLKDGLSDDRIG